MTSDTKTAVKKLSRDELKELSKEDLINRVLQLDAYNVQLKNTVKKLLSDAEDISSSLSRKRPFDFSKHKRRHILLKFLYLGWDYQGLASQENTMKTIESQVFTALTRACLVEDRQSCNYHRCGRTDKGVSSFGQTISLDIRSNLTEEEIKHGCTQGELNYAKILNRLLPEDIKVLSWRPVPQEFSARFNCKTRTYKYFFPKGNLNIDAMDVAAQHLLGTHDFRNLCKLDVKNGVVNYIRDVQFVKVSLLTRDPYHNSDYDLCELTIKSKAFLWHQIRCIMGVLILVGQNNEQPDIVKKLLDVDAHPCKPQYNMAADLPLNLFECEYECVAPEVEDVDGLEIVKRNLHRAWGQYSVRTGMIRSMLLKLESQESSCKLSFQAEWLLQGACPRVYQSLLKRPTCESLDGRIHHYRKKLKLDCLDKPVFKNSDNLD